MKSLLMVVVMLACIKICAQSVASLPSAPDPATVSDSASASAFADPVSVTPSLPSTPVPKKKAFDTQFAVLSGAFASASFADFKITLDKLKECPSCYKEADPVLRPFISSGAPAAYAFAAVLTGAMDWGAFEVKRRGKVKLAKTLLVVITSVHAGGALYNERLPSR